MFSRLAATSACRRNSRSHSITASGVLSMCDDSIELARLQRFLVALLIVDVGVHRIDTDDVAFAHRGSAHSGSTPSAARRSAATSSCSVETVSPCRTRVHERLQLARTLSPTTSPSRRPGQLLAAFRQPFLVVPVDEAQATVAVDVGDARRHVVHDEPQLGLARRARLPAPASGRGCRSSARTRRTPRPQARRPARRGSSSSGATPPAPGTSRSNDGRLALQRARQHRLRTGIDAVADDVAQAKLGDALAVSPKYCRKLRLTYWQCSSRSM